MNPFRRCLRLCIILSIVGVVVNAVLLWFIPDLTTSAGVLWSPDENVFDVFVPCDVNGCVEYLHRLPPSLWEAIRLHKMRIVLVVAGGRDALQKIVTSISSNVAVMLFDQSVPEFRPPVLKEVLMLRTFAWAADMPGIFVKLDFDAVFSPSALMSLVQTIPATRDDIYHGRPVTSCECNHRELPCAHPRALTYCSGFMYVSTRATLRRISPERFAMVKNGTRLCLSSDWTVGSIMRSEVALSCQPLVHPDSRQEEYSGYTWPLDQNGRKHTVRLPICQQIGSPGGIHDAHTISYPFFLTPSTTRPCVVAHPGKSAQDFQFMWNMLRDGADRTLPEDIRSYRECMSAIMILSLPAQFDSRQVIRMTWGAAARSYGMQLWFLVGKSNVLSISDAVLHENATFGDLLVFDVEEEYSHIAFKVGRGLLWLSKHSMCQFIVKTDMDTYIRPYQLVKSIEEVLASQPSELILMGHIWDGRKSGRPNVVKDPNNPWFINYTGDYYPPWASGYAFALSMSLARLVAPMYVRTAIGTAEDLWIGLMVEKLQETGHDVSIIHSRHFAYESECSDRTVADNPVMTNQPYNIMQRHEAHIRNRFCQLGPRKFMAGRSYAPNVGVHLPTLVSGNVNNRFLTISIAPWRRSEENDVFAFADARQEEFGISKESSKLLQKHYSTLRRLCSNCDVAVYRCVPCLDGWIAVQALNRTSGLPLFRQDILLGEDSQFGERIIEVPLFDVGVPHGCLPDRLLSFAQRLAGYFRPSWRLITTFSSCVGSEREELSSAEHLADWIAKGSGLNRSQVLVIGIPSFSRSLARNAIHRAARRDAILCVLDVDMVVQPAFLDRAAMFVHQNRTVYFPVVFSEFDPEMVRKATESFNKRPALDHQGKWRPYCHGNYAIHGDDAQQFWFDDSLREWGGENDAFFRQVRETRNIVRLQDDAIRHTWHPKNCTSVHSHVRKSCQAATVPFTQIQA